MLPVCASNSPDDTEISQGYTGDFIGRVMPRRSSVHNPRYCGSRHLGGYFSQITHCEVPLSRVSRSPGADDYGAHTHTGFPIVLLPPCPY